jgi:hypothetical protein
MQLYAEVAERLSVAAHEGTPPVGLVVMHPSGAPREQTAFPLAGDLDDHRAWLDTHVGQLEHELLALWLDLAGGDGLVISRESSLAEAAVEFVSQAVELAESAGVRRAVFMVDELNAVPMRLAYRIAGALAEALEAAPSARKPCILFASLFLPSVTVAYTERRQGGQPAWESPRELGSSGATRAALVARQSRLVRHGTAESHRVPHEDTILFVTGAARALREGLWSWSDTHEPWTETATSIAAHLSSDGAPVSLQELFTRNNHALCNAVARLCRGQTYVATCLRWGLVQHMHRDRGMEFEWPLEKEEWETWFLDRMVPPNPPGERHRDVNELVQQSIFALWTATSEELGLIEAVGVRALDGDDPRLEALLATLDAFEQIHVGTGRSGVSFEGRSLARDMLVSIGLLVPDTGEFTTLVHEALVDRDWAWTRASQLDPLVAKIAGNRLGRPGVETGTVRWLRGNLVRLPGWVAGVGPLTVWYRARQLGIVRRARLHPLLFSEPWDRIQIEALWGAVRLLAWLFIVPVIVSATIFDATQRQTLYIHVAGSATPEVQLDAASCFNKTTPYGCLTVSLSEETGGGVGAGGRSVANLINAASPEVASSVPMLSLYWWYAQANPNRGARRVTKLALAQRDITLQMDTFGELGDLQEKLGSEAAEASNDADPAVRVNIDSDYLAVGSDSSAPNDTFLHLLEPALMNEHLWISIRGERDRSDDGVPHTSDMNWPGCFVATTGWEDISSSGSGSPTVPEVFSKVFGCHAGSELLAELKRTGDGGGGSSGPYLGFGRLSSSPSVLLLLQTVIGDALSLSTALDIDRDRFQGGWQDSWSRSFVHLQIAAALPSQLLDASHGAGDAAGRGLHPHLLVVPCATLEPKTVLRQMGWAKDPSWEQTKKKRKKWLTDYDLNAATEYKSETIAKALVAACVPVVAADLWSSKPRPDLSEPERRGIQSGIDRFRKTWASWACAAKKSGGKVAEGIPGGLLLTPLAQRKPDARATWESWPVHQMVVECPKEKEDTVPQVENLPLGPKH